MKEHHSKVNFRKLVQDLADMYNDATFDVVLTELIANALDAKGSEISVNWDGEQRVLVVVDDGNGMDLEAFEQYHDFAAEIKARGDGIGFAGVGAKISFNIADRVITETQCDGVANASDWRWYDDGSLRWTRIRSDQLKTNGTRVEVRFNPNHPLAAIDAGYLIGVLQRHYLPLFVAKFVHSYAAVGIYPNRPQFKVNGSLVPIDDLCAMAVLNQAENLNLRSGNRSIGWGAIGVSERDGPLGDGAYGVLLCTHGKVIKAELFGLSTGSLGAKLFGIVEIPGLIEFLTTNKSDLKGKAGRPQALNRMLDPVREELRKFLRQHGIAMAEQRRNQLSAKLERELTKMVGRLPELQDFDGLLRRSQRLRKNQIGDVPTSEVRSRGEQEQTKNVNEDDTDNSIGGNSRKPDAKGKTRAKRQRSRSNQGPRVAFEEHHERDETAWLDSNTVIINSGHRAYSQRINQDQARLTYCMFAIGVALDKAGLVSPTDDVSYVDKFIAAWGQS